MNGTLDNLREAVLTDARALAYKVMQEAMREGEQVSADATAQVAKERDAALAKAQAEAERQRQRLFAEAEAEIQRERLVARERMIGVVLEEARKKLAAAASDPARGRELLLRLAVEGAKAVSGDTVKLVLRAEDRARADAAFLDAVKKESGKRAEVAEEILDSQRGSCGGLVITSKDGRERFDNTLADRLARRMADVRALIWTRVSHAG